jgi:hypothetical protein
MTDNPFDKACSCGAIYTVIHQELGPGALRHLLECWLSGDYQDLGRTIIPSRESLQRDADELTAIGLPAVASIVMEAAEVAPPSSEINCPYEEDTHNWTCWQASHQRKYSVIAL